MIVENIALDDRLRRATPENTKKPEIHGGYAHSHFCGDPEVEEKIGKELMVSVRCIPLDAEEEEGTCVLTGKPSKRRVIFAKSY